LGLFLSYYEYIIKRAQKFYENLNLGLFLSYYEYIIKRAQKFVDSFCYSPLVRGQGSFYSDGL